MKCFKKKLFYASSHFDIQKSKKNMDSPHNYHDRYSYKEAMKKVSWGHNSIKNIR